MIDSIGGRKVVALVVVVLLACGAVVLKGEVPANFADILKWAFGLFVAGNGVEHAAAAVASKSAPDGIVADVDLAPVEASLVALESEAVKTQAGVAAVQDILSAILKRINGQ